MGKKEAAMFTGLVEETGKVEQVRRNGSSLSIEIKCGFSNELVLGESVAVNGVCLTVAEKTDGGFFADVTPETFRRTSLAALENGGFVNLERAMLASSAGKNAGRFGGHIVQGHVDGTGVFLGSSADENAVNVKIRVPKTLGKYIVEKGSVCVDGISLTVADVKYSSSGAEFKVAVIPHTWKSTALRFKTAGSPVNIECDIVGKYIEHFLIWNEKYGSDDDFSESQNSEREEKSSENSELENGSLEELMRGFKSYH